MGYWSSGTRTSASSSVAAFMVFPISLFVSDSLSALATWSALVPVDPASRPRWPYRSRSPWGSRIRLTPRVSPLHWAAMSSLGHADQVSLNHHRPGGNVRCGRVVDCVSALNECRSHGFLLRLCFAFEPGHAPVVLLAHAEVEVHAEPDAERLELRVRPLDRRRLAPLEVADLERVHDLRVREQVPPPCSMRRCSSRSRGRDC